MSTGGGLAIRSNGWPSLGYVKNQKEQWYFNVTDCPVNSSINIYFDNDFCVGETTKRHKKCRGDDKIEIKMGKLKV